MTRRNLTFVLALAAAAVWARAATAQPKPDHYYNLEHKDSGKFVCTGATENGVQVRLWGPIPEGHEDRYAFKLVASEEDGYFYLIHKLSGKYICTESNDDAPVHLWGPIPEGHEDRFCSSSRGRAAGTITSCTSIPASTFARRDRSTTGPRSSSKARSPRATTPVSCSASPRRPRTWVAGWTSRVRRPSRMPGGNRAAPSGPYLFLFYPQTGALCEDTA